MRKRTTSERLKELVTRGVAQTPQPTEELTEKATVGIEIDKSFVRMAGNLRIWDCAGHIEYHVTHGMFLGVRNAIFIVPYDLSHSQEGQNITVSHANLHSTTRLLCAIGRR